MHNNWLNMACCQTICVNILFLVTSVRCKSLNLPYNEAVGINFEYGQVKNVSVKNINNTMDAVQATYKVKNKGPPPTDFCDEEWTKIRGRTNHVDFNTISCPRDGIINEITITYGHHEEGQRLHSISFNCISSLNVTDAGTFGKVRGRKRVLKCKNPKDHISYIKGAAGEYISDLHVECVKTFMRTSYNNYNNESYAQHFNQDQYIVRNTEDEQQIASNRPVKIDNFDDACYATKKRRPVEITIWAETFVNAIQIKYQNVPVAADCKISHIQLLEEGKSIEEKRLEVIGFTSGFTCSSLQQQINLDISNSWSESASTDKDDSEDWMGYWNIAIQDKMGSMDKVIVLFGHDLETKGSMGGLNGYGSSTSFVAGVNKQHATGTTINYKGPGMAFLVGYRITHTINNEKTPVLYHYTCTGGGSTPPERGTLDIHRSTFENVFFLDYQFTFNTTEDCLESSYPQECVSSILIKNFITHPDQLEKEFYKCFDKTEIQIPFRD